ncbi:DUF58 domain-containing protein [Calderihabitans maritimus]|uniref:DUF58 domain-containing protein n=1 Tax=Calderihabitans maritimus TaxID=1246530 RepID=A0A1Z5HRM4_9FIRM|nr:DUF58 domain-containing protein [Calderihabitans maritimus]GAW92179.1 hypothetical protein KKC1_13380 [Calderihabitans maritimus]
MVKSFLPLLVVFIFYVISWIMVGRFPLFLVLVGFGLDILLRLWVTVVVRHLQVSCRFYPGRSNVGERVLLAVTVTNPTFLPAPLVGVNVSLPDSLEACEEGSDFVLSLGPKRKTVREIELSCRRRGAVRIPLLQVKVSDPFYLFSGQKELVNIAEITIYPRIASCCNWPVQEGSGFSRREVQAANICLRPYQPGDSWQRIHWKASARTGQWFSKALEEGEEKKLFIILDLQGKNFSSSYEIEQLVSAAATVAYHASRKGWAVGLKTSALPSRLLLPAQGNLERILELLAIVEPELREHPGDSLRLSGVIQGSQVLIFTPDLARWQDKLAEYRRRVAAVQVVNDPTRILGGRNYAAL